MIRYRFALPLVLSLILARTTCWSLGSETNSPNLPTYRFDMGAVDSPVAAGHVAVSPGTLYTPERKFGWETGQLDSFDVPRPDEDPAWHQPTGQMVSQSLLIHKEHNDVTRDGVTSRGPVQFRVDVPNGVYRVALTMGRLDKPVCSLQILLNDQQVAVDWDAKHWMSRRRADGQYGFPRQLRRTVEVRDGVLRIRVQGDDSGFRRRLDQEYDKPAPGSFLEGTYFGGVYRAGRSLGPEVFVGSVKPVRGDFSGWGREPLSMSRIWVWEDVGGPFTEVAINGLEIYPYRPRPIEWQNGKLMANSRDEAVERGAEQFNAGAWREAEQAFDRATDPYAQALGYLWLAGRPQYEEERRLLPVALELLERLARERKDDLNSQEDLEGARRTARAIHRFFHRSDEQRSYTELIMVTGEVGSLEVDDPLYYKSRIYAGRAMYMIIPHRWTYAAGVGRQYFEELERAGFRDNRYVRWFLHDTWTPQPPDWMFPDYSAAKQGAPVWAAEIYEAYNRELDLGEWWIRNRQAADGSLGGGWGDDVEILRLLGAFASVSSDASPLLMDGIRQLVDGVWNCGSIDREAGYFAEVADSEHSGEWTADTLTSMIRLDYGNPLYVERALKTGKLMRDLWMDRTSQGQLLMRSNYLGATGIGGDGTSNDSRINFRPASPAYSVLAYNHLPTLQQLFLDWANTWWDASMSGQRGKPRGIIPQEIGFPSGQIGGERSPSWFVAEKLPGTGNYDWEGAGGYLNYLVDLFVHAYQMTGDAKYLEPLRLQAEFVERHLPPTARESVYVREGRLHPSLWEGLDPGSNAWVAARLATWPAQWANLRRRLFAEPLENTPQTERLDDAARRAADENDGARRRWPHTTSEAMATDRIYYPGMGNALRIMTGAADHGEGSLVSYRGLGREFAAVLLRADSAHVRIVLFNMDQQGKDASFVPWLLPPGDEFELVIGPDENNDGLHDRVGQRRRLRIESKGQEVPFRIEPRAQIVIEMRRVSRYVARHLLPDLAIHPGDIQFRSEYAQIDVAVHNIGSTTAERVTVVLLDDRNHEVGRKLIPHLDAPLDFNPQIVRVGFPIDFASAAKRKFTASIDPDNVVREITELNNRATAVCPEKLAPRRIHSHP